MKFGEVPIDEAVGAVLAHSLRTSDGRLKKGRLLSEADVESLRRAGYAEVAVARLEDEDESEDEAAANIARLADGPGLERGKAFTGRVNLSASAAGILVVDIRGVDLLNEVDESITLCTLPAWSQVSAGQQVATVKIIPLAIDRSLLDDAARRLENRTLLRVAPFRTRTIGLLQTTLPGTPEGLLDKMTQVTRRRLTGLACSLDHEWRCGHEAGAVAAGIRTLIERGCELVCMLGASAIVDRRDVLPAGVVAAGGTVERFGLPVDPGNLILIARCGSVALLGLPGSVRSPRTSGFDQVLRRIVADVPPSALDIAGMGVGGLLKGDENKSGAARP